jgi:hypothetical protein
MVLAPIIFNSISMPILYRHPTLRNDREFKRSVMIGRGNQFGVAGGCQNFDR